MQRYSVETVDPYDMMPDPKGMWVLYDEKLFVLAKVLAEVHIGDGDELGVVARELLSLLEGA